MPRKRATPQNDDDLRTRERILAAAHRVFLRLGTAKARTVDIADEAGVNKALLHYYFSSKANLANAVFAEAVGQLMPRLSGILGDPALPLDDKVRRAIVEQIDFHGSRPYLAPYVVSEMHTEPERLRSIVAAAGPPPVAVLEAQLVAEAAAGRIRPIGVQQFVVNLIAWVVFPFMARPMLEIVAGLDPRTFPAFLEERKRILPELFLASLRP